MWAQISTRNSMKPRNQNHNRAIAARRFQFVQFMRAIVAAKGRMCVKERLIEERRRQNNWSTKWRVVERRRRGGSIEQTNLPASMQIRSRSPSVRDVSCAARPRKGV